MSATIVARERGAAPASAKQRRHRFWMWSGAVAAIAMTVALAGYGVDYYVLSAAKRVTSAKHVPLKPSGWIGHGLGIVGGVMLLLMYLYPLRKRWKWLAKKGKTRHWLDYHILLGFAGPALITFHSTFKFQGIAGLAYWMMVAVVASGVVGRYFYSKIPRKLDQVEMSLDEMAQVCAELTRLIQAQNLLPVKDLRPLVELPHLEQVQSMPLVKALAQIVWLDLRRSWLFARLRWGAGAYVADSAELKQVLTIVRKQAALSKDALFLSRMRQLFHLWHIIHRPFSYSLAILATLHVVVVMFLGYF
jgi:hypothetical protein